MKPVMLTRTFDSRSGRRRVPLVLLLFLALALGVTASPGLARGKNKAEKSTFTASGAWEAYYHTDKGVDKAILQPLEENKDKDWMFLQFTGYQGPRLRIAVVEVDNSASTVAAVATSGDEEATLEIQRSQIPLGSIEDLLTTAVLNTNRFDVVERQAIGTVLAEQDFGAEGRVSKPTAPEIGKVLGADYLIFASINEWTPEKKKMSGGGGGVFGKALGGVGGNKKTAEVLMSFRVVDATTGQVLFSTAERATAGSWGLSGLGFGGGLGGFGGFEKNAPINYAVQACLNKGTYRLAMWLKERPWTGSISLVDGGSFYINAGSDRGLVSGMRLKALAKGKEVVDPETGLTLGSVTTVAGELKIVDVQERFATAQAVEGCEELKKGDRVELLPDRGVGEAR